MTATNLKQLIEQLEALPLAEQLQLIAHVAERARHRSQATSSRHRWSEIRGIAQYPLLGEDAQAWVSRTRREGDAHRERQLERKP
jgi:hypothetical protein